MSERSLCPFREKPDLETRYSSRWSDIFDAGVVIEREEEWLGWDAWVSVERLL